MSVLNNGLIEGSQMSKAYDWDACGLEDLDKTGLLVSPPDWHEDYVVIIDKVTPDSSCIGSIYILPTWQKGDKPPCGAIIRTCNPIEALYEVQVFRKYYFVDTDTSLQMYYDKDRSEVDAHAFVLNKARDWLLLQAGIVPYGLEER